MITLFAGRPPPSATLTPWDASCGFACGDDVVERRREEDRRALALLGARPAWLEFLDAQYGRALDAPALAAGIAAALADMRPARVAFPLALFHSDHLLASNAALQLAGERHEIEWIVYDDALYRAIDDASVTRRTALEAHGWH